MKRIISVNIGTIITFLVMFTIAYYVLLQDNFMHISISSIITRAHYLEIKRHLIVLGLLPVYIATIIFGAGIASVYLGAGVQSLIRKACKQQP